MTENEAVERMRSLIAQAVRERQAESWTTVAARTALTSHPAVEALRELIEAHDTLQNTPHSDDDYRTELRIAEQNYESAWSEARSVLASLPKEK